jgi:hypothetical protein
MATVARERRCPAGLAAREPDAVEKDLLGVRHQPRHREQALEVRNRGDRVAAEREAGADEAVDGVLNQPGKGKLAIRCGALERLGRGLSGLSSAVGIAGSGCGG